MKFLIIGGDAAGMSAASRAKRNNPEMNVTVLEATDDVSYSACGMPYNIANPEVEIEDLVVRKADVFREKQGIDLRTGHRAFSIERDSKTVSGKETNGSDFTFPYDRLLIATGARPAIPDLPGFDSKGVMALKSLSDGRNIKAFVRERAVKKAVIIGMGYIALEMCEALRERDIQVEMVKPRAVFLPWMNQEMAEAVKGEVEKNGVKVHLGQDIKGIERHGDDLRVTCPDLDLAAQMVLVATGIRPLNELASSAGLELGPSGAISVDRYLRTSDPEIFSAGDCADAYHVVTGKKTWIPLALRANRAGWAVADNLEELRTSLEGVAGTAVFKVFDLQVARTGLGVHEARKAGFDPVEMMIKSITRASSYPGGSRIHVQLVADRSTGRLLGGQLLGREGAAHRVNALAVALHQKMTVRDFSQCDLAYAPPFGPTWDPMLTAANQMLKKLG